MNIAETALPKTEKCFRPEYGLLPYFTEIDKSRCASGQAILQNEAATNLEGKGLFMFDFLSSETGNIQWVNGQAILLGGADTSFANKMKLSHSVFVDVILAGNPGIGTILNFNVGRMTQNLAGTWSPDILANEPVLKDTAREDHVSEMISSSQKILTVAAAVFNNVRPLTDKERRHLRTFYNRAYKPK
jgi:hypothetical protein